MEIPGQTQQNTDRPLSVLPHTRGGLHASPSVPGVPPVPGPPEEPSFHPSVVADLESSVHPQHPGTSVVASQGRNEGASASAADRDSCLRMGFGISSI